MNKSIHDIVKQINELDKKRIDLVKSKIGKAISYVRENTTDIPIQDIIKNVCDYVIGKSSIFSAAKTSSPQKLRIKQPKIYQYRSGMSNAKRITTFRSKTKSPKGTRNPVKVGKQRGDK